MSSEPPFFAPAQFDDATEALARARLIYETNASWLREALGRFAGGEDFPAPVHAYYPYVRLRTTSFARAGSRLSYGFVAGPGQYETTLTRPDLFGPYYLEQFRLLLENHAVPLEVGTGRQPIPLQFTAHGGAHLEGELDIERQHFLREVFDLPDLAAMDDGIADGTHEPRPGAPRPLALFNAPRVDYSLHRLLHYTGTSPEHFQNFILFTNYQFYLDEFHRIGHGLMAEPAAAHGYESFVEPGNVVTRRADTVGAATGTAGTGEAAGRAAPGAPPPRLPQMPAYHLVRPDRAGITMVNIGVGPSSARTITDHIAVLRPHAWIMLGHCAGLRTTQRLGDYVLAHGYIREDHVLDEELPLWVPIPALAEVQVALESAVADITGLREQERKRVMRTGTVASTGNRNWELVPARGIASTPERRFSQSRAIALDMESATIAANGFRFRVPYGTLLCVSDKPLHGEIKLPGMADRFYRERIEQHLRIGIRALELLREQGVDRLHSRKLRSFAEVAFQ